MKQPWDGVTILYAEDEESWVEEVRAQLPTARVLHAPTVERALEMATDPEIRVALVDLEWSGRPQSGLELVRQLRARRPDFGILVVTAHDDMPSVRDSLRYGADYLVNKTASLAETLGGALSTLLMRASSSRGVELQRLTIERFKCWRTRSELELGGLTLLLGTNSSGKSTVLHALLLLKQTAESADRSLPLQVGGPHARQLDLGSFEDVAYGHDAERGVKLGLSWRVPQHAEPLLFETSVARVDGRLRTRGFEYRRGIERYGMTWESQDYVVHGTGADGSTSSGRATSTVKCYGFPAEALSRVTPAHAETIRDLQLAFEQLMERVLYLGPLRERPRREYTWTGERPSSVGSFGDRAIEALLALDRDADRFTWRTDDGEISAAALVSTLLEQLGLARSFRLNQLSSRQYEVRLAVGDNAVEASLADVGFGVSQVLPILVLGLYAPEGSVVLVEQPELHLHPAAQVGLADVFLEFARRRRIQFIVETHSEHLFKRVQRRVAERQWSADDVRLYFCQRTPEGSYPERLRLDASGNVANWPSNFFGNPAGESAARLKAGLVQQLPRA